MSTTMNSTKVIIPCRFSYAHIFEPNSVNGSDPKYSVSLIIDKQDKDTIAKAFGEVTYVSAGIEGETGFTTGEMTEAEFEENAAEINIINRIRLG